MVRGGGGGMGGENTVGGQFGWLACRCALVFTEVADSCEELDVF